MHKPIPLFIVHWNRPEECARTVREFLGQHFPLNITVLDNASEAGNLARLRETLPPAVTVATFPTNLGWGAALNVVLRKWLHSPDDYCILSAHDALPADGCLHKLWAAMEAHKNVGFACPQYEHAGVLRFSPLRGMCSERAPRQPAGAIQDMDAPHGTLVMVRRQCLQTVGLFDERYFAYGDEAEIGLRAKRHGWRSAMVWGATVTNPGTWSPRPVISYLVARNTLLTVRTYGGLAWAVLRFALKLATGARDQHGLWAGRSMLLARLLGMADFARGRFGAPPKHLLPAKR